MGRLNRRGFLRGLLSSVAAVAVAPVTSLAKLAPAPVSPYLRMFSKPIVLKSRQAGLSSMAALHAYYARVVAAQHAEAVRTRLANALRADAGIPPALQANASSSSGVRRALGGQLHDGEESVQ